MSTNYKRHSQGKGFRKINFGDMGLRAYREQQQTIINALKLQNKEFESTHKDTINAEIGKVDREMQNRRELKKLQDDVYDVKFKNTELKHKREMELLEADLKEKQAGADFWVDFSSTYAKQYADAANTVLGAIDLKKAQKDINEYINSGELANSLENSHVLDNITAENMDTFAEKYLADNKISKEEKNELGSLFSDVKRKNSFNYHSGLIEIFKERWSGIQQDAIQTVGLREGFTVDEDNIDDILSIRAIELLNEAGIPLRSRASINFMKFVNGKSLDERTKIVTDKKVIRDTGNINAAADEFKSSISKKEKLKGEKNLNTLIRLQRFRTVKSEDGTFSITNLSHPEALLAVIQILGDKGILTNTTQLDNWILDQPYPGQEGSLVGKNIEAFKNGKPIKDNRKTWRDRYKNTDLINDSYTVLKEGLDKFKEDKKTKDGIADISDTNEINASIKNGSLDLRDPKAMQTARLKYTGSGTGKGIELLQKYELVNKIDRNKDGYILTPAAIKDLAKDGKLQQFEEAVSFLPKKAQEEFTAMLNGLKKMDSIGFNHKKIEEFVFGILDKHQKLGSIEKVKGGDFALLLKDGIQDVYFELNKYDHRDDLSPQDIQQKVVDAVTKKVDNKEGIYRRDRDEGGVATEWLAYKSEPSSNLATNKEISDFLEDNGLDNLIKNIEVNKGQLVLNGNITRNVITQDEVDMLHKNLLTGDRYAGSKFPSVVDHIYKNQVAITGETFKTKAEIYSNILKLSGINVNLPKAGLNGQIEYCKYIANKDKIFNIPNYAKYSAEDQQACTLALEIFTENGKWITPPRLKETDEIRNNYLNGIKKLPEFDK